MDLLALLCVLLLGICSPLASGNDVKSAPPEDLDGSGDDEDFSGSGFGDIFESKSVDVFSTPVSPLVTTVEQEAHAPVVAVEEEAKVENSTKPHEPIEEEFAVVPVAKEPSAEESTTLRLTTQETSTVDSDLEKKHHPHTHHPHHHTTTSQSTTESPAEVEKPLIVPVESTTSAPDEPDVDGKQKTEGSVHVIHHQDATSGSSSTPYTDNVETTADPSVIHEFPVFVDFGEKTTVADETHTQEGHHPHHHPHHHTTTTKPTEGSDTLIEELIPTPSDKLEPEGDGDQQEQPTTTSSDGLVPEEGDDQQEQPTTSPSDELVPAGHPDDPEQPTTTSSDGLVPVEGDDQQEQHTSTPSVELMPEEGGDQQEQPTTSPDEDKHHHHGHHPHHHHTTTPEATQSTESKPFIVPTQDSKGRRIHVPLAETTTTVPAPKEEDEDRQENVDDVSSTVQYNHSVVPVQDENEDATDSKEDDSSGEGPVDTDFFLEPTIVKTNQNENKAAAPPSDGTSDASHGIMERTELLVGIIAGGVAGLVFAAFLVAFVFYRMKKKDEGSYSLEEPKQSNGGYQKPREQREFYA